MPVVQLRAGSQGRGDKSWTSRQGKQRSEGGRKSAWKALCHVTAEGASALRLAAESDGPQHCCHAADRVSLCWWCHLVAKQWCAPG